MWLRLIEPFQSGETSTFIEHIKAGLDELAANRNAILVFSGGDTKSTHTSRAESTSYRALTLANNNFGHPASLTHRISLDIYATDSFQNVLFPLLAFNLHVVHCGWTPDTRTEVQLYPLHLTIIGHEFKRRRFVELHLPAIGYPTDSTSFEYIGIDPPMDFAKKSEVMAGELSRGHGAWQTDLYGVKNVLAAKRKARGWSDDKANAVENLVTRAWGGRSTKDKALELLRWDGGESGVEVYVFPWVL